MAIRARRRALGLTIEQLAERSDLSPNYVGELERGLRDPSLSTLCALADGLGEHPCDLLGDASKTNVLPIEITQLFAEVPDDIRTALLAMLRAFRRYAYQCGNTEGIRTNSSDTLGSQA